MFRLLECKTDIYGREYGGILSMAESGKRCQSWKVYGSSLRTELYNFPEGDIGEASNYCRNPTLDVKGPWCYVSGGVNEYCQLPMCAQTSGMYTCIYINI